MFCFSNTCRICKCSINSFTLTCNMQKEVTKLFFSMFPELMNSEVNHFLKNLCVSCVEQLKLFETFKDHCIESDRRYMRYLGQLEGHDGMYAELACGLGIKKEHCQNDDSQQTLDTHGIQEASSYYGLEEDSSSTTKDIQINIVKQEISISVIKEENEGDVEEEAISIFGCQESGSEDIRGSFMLTNQELFAPDYHNSTDEEIVAVNENKIDFIEETVQLSSIGGIKDFHSEVNDSSNITRKENNNINLKYCQGKDDVSSITKDNIHEIDIIKHEVCKIGKDESCNSIDTSINNNKRQEITEKKLSLNHQSTHTVKKFNQCDLCKKSFLYKSLLMRHKRTHTGEKPYECDLCKMRFSRESHLKEHKRTHTGEKPYQCDTCEKSFSQKSNMISHKRTHTGEKPYQCDLCKKSFLLKKDLMRHIQTHTGEKPYECDICKKRFSRKQILDFHTGIHTGEKPYQCDLCEKSFLDKSYLNKHKRTHTGEKV